MTAVEFWDKRSVENIISSLISQPDKVILVGEGKKTQVFAQRYRAFLAQRGQNTLVETRSIRRNSLRDIVAVLSDIVETEEQCMFDLTGGEDLALVAMGIVFQLYPEKKIQMQRCNVASGVITDCDGDNEILYERKPKLSVEELIAIHGGQVRHSSDTRKATPTWNLTPEFAADVDTMWQLCKADPALWNSRIRILAAMEHLCQGQQELLLDKQELHNALRQARIREVDMTPFLKELYRRGLIHSYWETGERLSLQFKDSQIRQCLLTAGLVLELKIYLTALQLQDSQGRFLCTDARNGVVIDWDAQLQPQEGSDTENEIDVILMQGLLPLFISCKNGFIDTEELYKLDAVTSRFGGAYAKKALVCTYFGKQGSAVDYFRRRARDMHIQLVENVHEMTDEELRRALRRCLLG